jgi:hypothetical protein
MRYTLILLCVLGLGVSGCATATRAGQFGELPNGQPLVTLIVTEDHDIVVHGCAGIVVKHGVVAGCQRSRRVAFDGERTFRSVTIVRYTDWLPSSLAFEIDGRQLCHAIADLQSIEDPCHAENDGMMEAAMPGLSRPVD